jgi:acetyl-CoA carboxylase biotin carboxylase subunit
LYAEDPETNFLPSPGLIQRLASPSGPGIRLDSGVYPGWTVPMDYDPLLAKLATWAETRELSIDRMRRALSETSVMGIRTNIEFFQALLADTEFRRGALHTGFIEEFLARRPVATEDADLPLLAALAAAVHARKTRPAATAAVAPPSQWLASGLRRLHR